MNYSELLTLKNMVAAINKLRLLLQFQSKSKNEGVEALCDKMKLRKTFGYREFTFTC
jgi:hypothetical protein